MRSSATAIAKGDGWLRIIIYAAMTFVDFVHSPNFMDINSL